MTKAVSLGQPRGGVRPGTGNSKRVRVFPRQDIPGRIPVTAVSRRPPVYYVYSTTPYRMQPGAVSDRIASAHSLSNSRQATHADAIQPGRFRLLPGSSMPFGSASSGRSPFRCSAFLRSVVWLPHALRDALLVGGPLPVGGPVCCRHALRCGPLLMLVVSASSAHRLHSPLPIPSIPRLSFGLPGIMHYTGQCAFALRYYCTPNGKTGTGLATDMRSICCRLLSSAPLLLFPCSAHDTQTMRTRSAGLRSSVCGLRDRKGNGKGNWKCYGKRKGQRQTFRAPLSWGNICTVFGTKNPNSAQKIWNWKWKIGNRKRENQLGNGKSTHQTDGPKDITGKAPGVLFEIQKIR